MYNHHPDSQYKNYSDFEKRHPNSTVIPAVLTFLATPDGTTTKVTFSVQKDGTALLPTEMRIEKNDIVAIYGYQLFVRKMKISGKKVYPCSEEMTFADTKVFFGKKGEVSEVESIRSIWDGTLQFGNRKAIRLQPHSTKTLLFDEMNRANDTNGSRGYVLLRAPILVRGDETDEFTLLLPDYLQDAIQGNTDENGKENNKFNVIGINCLVFLAIDAIKKEK